MSHSEPTILRADDEETLADGYAARLESVESEPEAVLADLPKQDRYLVAAGGADPAGSAPSQG